MNNSQGVLNDDIILNLSKVKSYLIQVVNSAFRNIISRMESQGLNTQGLASSLDELKSYVVNIINPI